MVLETAVCPGLRAAPLLYAARRQVRRTTSHGAVGGRTETTTMSGTDTETTATRVTGETGPDGVLVLTLDGPGRRNAMGRTTVAELDAALDRAWQDDSVRVVVLTGSGGHFTAGADLKGATLLGGDPRLVPPVTPVPALDPVHRVLDKLHRLPKPTIAAVEGCAVGVGWSFALACDLAIAAENGFFQAPFTSIGLVPDGGCAWFLTQAIGVRRAAELLLHGKRLPAARAEQLGLVNRVVADGAALEEAVTDAAQLAAGAQDALRLTKHILRAAERTPSYRDFLDIELTTAGLALRGPEPREGVLAFRERRKPDFRRG
ncbi:enoyl-CoA hydratase-related protein [Streptomyces sp. NPDC051453]|uniref:enoyl-CoA hydratase-related protein n=1 Tax=Streptomyces sp. NPDC051453 TaxID=3154941 RepID=UPI0034445490